MDTPIAEHVTDHLAEHLMNYHDDQLAYYRLYLLNLFGMAGKAFLPVNRRLTRFLKPCPLRYWDTMFIFQYSCENNHKI